MTEGRTNLPVTNTGRREVAIREATAVSSADVADILAGVASAVSDPDDASIDLDVHRSADGAFDLKVRFRTYRRATR